MTDTINQSILEEFEKFKQQNAQQQESMTRTYDVSSKKLRTGKSIANAMTSSLKIASGSEDTANVQSKKGAIANYFSQRHIGLFFRDVAVSPFRLAYYIYSAPFKLISKGLDSINKKIQGSYYHIKPFENKWKAMNGWKKFLYTITFPITLVSLCSKAVSLQLFKETKLAKKFNSLVSPTEFNRKLKDSESKFIEISKQHNSKIEELIKSAKLIENEWLKTKENYFKLAIRAAQLAEGTEKDKEAAQNKILQRMDKHLESKEKEINKKINSANCIREDIMIRYANIIEKRKAYNEILDKNVTKRTINTLSANRIEDTEALPSKLSNLHNLITSGDIEQVKITTKKTEGNYNTK